MEAPVLRKAPAFSERELWEKYLAVTREMLKRIELQDIDVFLQLVEQRQQLLEKLKAIPQEEHIFGTSPEGVALREEIKPMDMEIMYRARTWLNKSRNNTATVKGYDLGGYGMAGNLFNRSY